LIEWNCKRGRETRCDPKKKNRIRGKGKAVFSNSFDAKEEYQNLPGGFLSATRSSRLELELEKGRPKELN